MQEDLYHGILLNVSFTDKKYPERFEIFNKITFEDSDWVVYGIKLRGKTIEETVKEIQDKMLDGKFFNHVYNANTLIIIFKDKVIKLPKESLDLSEAIAYGQSLEIPTDQLNFKPYRFEDEEAYFNN